MTPALTCWLGLLDQDHFHIGQEAPCDNEMLEVNDFGGWIKDSLSLWTFGCWAGCIHDPLSLR